MAATARLPPKLRHAAILSIFPLVVFLFVTRGYNAGERPLLRTPSDSSDIDNSIIIPAYHEQPNVNALVTRIFTAVQNPSKTEVVIVDDDSQDGTIEEVERLKGEGYQVVLVVRKNASGLSSAVLRGFQEARGKKMVVMDADLQHPPETIPKILDALTKDTPFVIGTRYGKGGGIDKDWPIYRRLMSWGARMLARPLTPASDPMTGFFGLTAELYNSSAPVNPIGFKICLELLLKTGVARNEVAEVPFGFSKRAVGQSKLSSKVIIRYVGHLAALYRWRIGWFGLILLEAALVGVIWLTIHGATLGWVWWRQRQRQSFRRHQKLRYDV